MARQASTAGQMLAQVNGTASHVAAIGRICAACRRTRLSRYNPQQVCASCVRAARQPPEAGPQWPTWLWGSVPMRQVLARCDLGVAVAMFRVAAELSQQELAELADWSQSAVSLVETGRRDTLYDIRELLRFADAVAMPREALLPVLLGRPAVLIKADIATGDGGGRS